MLTPRDVEVLALSNVKEVTMYAIKRELKLNNKEKSFFAGCAGFSRFVYNHGLSVAQSHLGNSRFALPVTQNG
ncbi:MAG: helix-turn-helix domain-containing protein [Trichodesmium sp. St16_bin2-tuft]|nr:helix-turn-helix domain-containing protein [Trichodesmium sp. St5_bin2_1]MDE5087665.1 helix-turn-helix domain-containing protein [Trichodesmium sp. St16_bin2-tuft]MDE5109991.1 helix-turn-helix domain-containing protein [Trichodesmium sp. St7_bin2_1]MDE5118069.1 helix-turn-helix domain-containing protein [Trichodesmium sp. St2_bin2_1]